MTQPRRVRRLTGRLVAEFIVIVLGVWIALWAEGWAADREDRAVETARLRALSENVEQTLAAVRSEQDDATGAAEALRDLILRAEVTTDAEGVREALAYGLLYVPAFTPELNVYEDLKSSGELGLLTSPKLRQALSAMEAALDNVDGAQRDMSTVQQLNYDRYLLARVDLRPVLGPILGLPNQAPPSYSDVDFILTTEFRNLALFKLDLIRGTQAALEEAEERLMTVERIIDELLQSSEKSEAG